MTKASGLGDNLYLGGYDVSGDTRSLDIDSQVSPIDVTGIDKSAHERVGGQRDATLKTTTYLNPAAGRAHAVYSTLPTTDRIATYCRGTTLGSAALCMQARQIGYDPKRGDDGAILIDVEVLSDGYASEWGRQLTAGLRVDAAATNGASIDDGAATSFGAQAYLQVTAIPTAPTAVKIQHSTDDATWVDLITFTPTVIGATRAATATATTTVNRYLRAITTGASVGITFNAVICRNETATTF